jgi:alpha-amylase
MKKITKLSLLALLSISLVACGGEVTTDDQKPTDKPTEPKPTEVLPTEEKPTEELPTEPTPTEPTPTEPVEEIPTVSTENYALYVEAPLDWETVNVYYWSDQGLIAEDYISVWPGETMVKVNEVKSVWGFALPAGVEKVIFNDGSAQTTDLTLIQDKNLFVITEAGADGKFVATADVYTPEEGEPELPTKKPLPKVENIDLYIQVPGYWTTPYIHTWGLDSTTWPGVALTPVEGFDNIYYFPSFNPLNNFLVHSNAGEQTANLKLPEDSNLNGVVVADDFTVEYMMYADGVFIPAA